MKKAIEATAAPVAYSYVRFSHPDQARGDSLRRQTEAAREWCARKKITLDTSTTLRDLGKSAFTGAHRENPDRHALALFLKMVETGRVARGTYLLIENLDRLSREDEVPACHLLTSILMAGVTVVQLSPYEMVLTDKSNGWELMRAVMELSRGHGESAVKSDRVGKAWRKKKAAAREKKTPLTRRVPAWVRRDGDRLMLIPERAAVVKRVFALAAAGYGLANIVKRLTEDKVPAFGDRRRVAVLDGDGEPALDERGKPVYSWQAKDGGPLGSGRWIKSYIASILADRRAVGEFQPRTKKGGKPDGAPIPGYFPAAVTEAEWLAARAGAAERRRKPGRTAKHVNVFSGLVRNALGGDTYFMMTRSRSDPRRKPKRILINGDANEGVASCRTFPFDPFERAVLSELAEVDPGEVTGRDDGPDEVMVLSGELSRVASSIAAIEAEMDANGESPTLFRRLRAKEEAHRSLVERLNAAREKAAHPLSEAWGEAHTLLGALDGAPDPRDARLRLRSVLRRVVEEIRLLVVPRGACRLAAVRVQFAGDGHRDYLIFYRPARTGRPEQHRVRSFKEADIPTDLDLRDRKDAADLARTLERVDVALLAAALK
jgi:DNA invertase Pin-like site-specific DNA recombinase